MMALIQPANNRLHGLPPLRSEGIARSFWMEDGIHLGVYVEDPKEIRMIMTCATDPVLVNHSWQLLTSVERS